MKGIDHAWGLLGRRSHKPPWRFTIGTSPVDKPASSTKRRPRLVAAAPVVDDPWARRRRDKVKVLYWDQNGFVLYMKRLEKGRFQLPVVDEKRTKVEMQSQQLQMLLRSIDLNAKRLERWSPSIAEGIDSDP